MANTEKAPRKEAPQIKVTADIASERQDLIDTYLSDCGYDVGRDATGKVVKTPRKFQAFISDPNVPDEVYARRGYIPVKYENGDQVHDRGDKFWKRPSEYYERAMNASADMSENLAAGVESTASQNGLQTMSAPGDG